MEIDRVLQDIKDLAIPIGTVAPIVLYRDVRSLVLTHDNNQQEYINQLRDEIEEGESIIDDMERAKTELAGELEDMNNILTFRDNTIDILQIEKSDLEEEVARLESGTYESRG